MRRVSCLESPALRSAEMRKVPRSLPLRRALREPAISSSSSRLPNSTSAMVLRARRRAPNDEIAGPRILDAGYRATSSCRPSWRPSSYRRLHPDRSPDRLLCLPCSASSCALNALPGFEQLLELLQMNLDVGPPRVPAVVVDAPASLQGRSTGLGADGVIVGGRRVAFQPHGPRGHQPGTPLPLAL